MSALASSPPQGQLIIPIDTPVAFEGLYRPHRNKIMRGGRGGAKSWAVGDALVAQASSTPLRILCTREKQNSIKQSVHSLLASIIRRRGIPGWTIGEKSIRHRNGSEFFFMGLWRNEDSIKSTEGVDICWVEEAHSVSDHSWETLIPTIRKEGSEIWATFNPNQKTDAVWERFIVNPPPDTWSIEVSWRDNPWFTDVLRQEMEHDKETDHDKYMHIWEGQFKQFADGAIYAAQIRKMREEGRICRVPYEPHVEVHTFWDLGRGDSTAIVFMQQVGLEYHVIDYYEHSQVELDHYIRVLKDKPYNYGRHYLPHDVEVTELTSKRGSRRDILESGGIKPITVVPRIPRVEEGIEQTRAMFPKLWIDERLERFIECLSNYKYKFNDDSQTFSLSPDHTWASDAADALRQMAQGYKRRQKINLDELRPSPHYFE